MSDYPERRQTDAALEGVRREADFRFSAVEARFAAQEMALVAALAAAKEATTLVAVSAKEAVGKAESAADKRFEEIRERIDVLTASMNVVVGQDKASAQVFTRGIAVATVIISVLVVVVNVMLAK